MMENHSISLRMMVLTVAAAAILPLSGKPSSVRNSLPEPVDGVCLISDTIDLNGQTVTIPAATTLKFRGGILINGILLGNDTKIEADNDAHIFDASLRMGGSWSVTACPEWFGACGDGIALYDRPLRCYNGEVNDPVLKNVASRTCIQYPSDHIVNSDFWEYVPYPNTRQVVYCPSQCCFLLHEGENYYSRWGNSEEWNDPKTGKARADRVFSDLTTRISTIFSNGSMCDIDSLMTDDTPAFRRAILMGRGNINLRPVVYYCKLDDTNGPNTTPWRNLSNFHVKGNGATLFLRTKAKGHPQRFSQDTWAWMYHCSHGEISDLQVRCLRDRDDGAPHNHHRLSSSDSRCVAFGIFGCQDLRFSNLSFKGMSHDFIVKNGYGMSTGITIDGWQSKDFTQNVFGGVRGCHVKHADLQQADMLGDGMHIIYGQTLLRQFHVSDGHFKAGNNTSVMLTCHGGRKDLFPDSIYYRNCLIEGARMIQGQGFQQQSFDNCTFRQTADSILTSKGKKEANNYAVIATRINLKFTNCIFELKSSGLVNAAKIDGPTTTLMMNNCQVKAPHVGRTLINHPGDIHITQCNIHCAGSLHSNSGHVTLRNNQITQGLKQQKKGKQIKKT